MNKRQEQQILDYYSTADKYIRSKTHSNAHQTVFTKLNALSEKTCAELTATTKRRKLTERDHSIKARLARAKEQAKQPAVAGGKKHRTHSKGKGDMAL